MVIDADRLRKIFEAPNTISSCLGKRDGSLVELSSKHKFTKDEDGNILRMESFYQFESDRMNKEQFKIDWSKK